MTKECRVHSIDESNIISNHGCDIFVQDGYMYVFEKLNFNRINHFWSCQNEDMCKCRVYIGVDDYIIIKKISDYTHDSEAAKIEVLVYAAITNI